MPRQIAGTLEGIGFVAQGVGVTDPDKALIERCRRRDQAAFDEIVVRYKQRIYNYLYRMLSDPHEAEDLTQDVFVRMFLALDTFRSQSSLQTWLFRIAGNLCIDHFRRDKKRRAHAYSLDEPAPGGDGGEGAAPAREIADTTYEPHRQLERQELSGQIQAALSRLPEKLRAVIILYDLDGMSYEEIAMLLGCPLGTVKSRLFNARLQLRQQLGDYLRPEA